MIVTSFSNGRGLGFTVTADKHPDAISGRAQFSEPSSALQMTFKCHAGSKEIFVADFDNIADTRSPRLAQVHLATPQSLAMLFPQMKCEAMCPLCLAGLALVSIRAAEKSLGASEPILDGVCNISIFRIKNRPANPPKPVITDRNERPALRSRYQFHSGPLYAQGRVGLSVDEEWAVTLAELDTAPRCSNAGYDAGLRRRLIPTFLCAAHRPERVVLL